MYLLSGIYFLQTNTFQGILITDGSHSYTVFTYRCGSMEWSGSATIGFNADNDLFQNHPLSRTRSSNSIACQNYPDSVWNNLVYQLGGISSIVPNPSPTSSTGNTLMCGPIFRLSHAVELAVLFCPTFYCRLAVLSESLVKRPLYTGSYK